MIFLGVAVLSQFPMSSFMKIFNKKYHKIAQIDHEVGIFKKKEDMENCPKATNPTNI